MSDAAVSAEDVYNEAAAIITRRLSDGRHLASEYRSVLQNDLLIEHSVQDSQRTENTARNRYVNVLPFDYNRVMLVSGSQPYVNASIVRHADRTVGAESIYLAAQGPMPGTVADFWRMVVEQHVPIIIMLTKLTERGTVKCHSYYPDAVGSKLSPAPDVSVTTVAIEQRHSGQTTVRTLEVTAGCVTSGAPWRVTHLYYHAWPDHGAPAESSAIRSMCELLHPASPPSSQSQQDASSAPSSGTHPTDQPPGARAPSATPVLPAASTGPPAALAAMPCGAGGTAAALPPRSAVQWGTGHLIVSTAAPGASGGLPASAPAAAVQPPPPVQPRALVHCSAGIGRTGTFIALDILCQRLHWLAARAGSTALPRGAASRLVSEALDVPSLVHELRQQRMGMVQTYEQYAFIYQALLEELQAAAPHA